MDHTRERPARHATHTTDIRPLVTGFFPEKAWESRKTNARFEAALGKLATTILTLPEAPDIKDWPFNHGRYESSDQKTRRYQ